MPAGAAAANAARHRAQEAHPHSPSGAHHKKSKPVLLEEVHEPQTGWRKYQPAASKAYNHISVQATVASLIGFNFLVNIIQAQIDPNQDLYVDEFGAFDLFFNLAFLVELGLNMYSSWLCKFWKSGWNVFDFFVVVIGWMFQLRIPLPGPMKLLRMMRAFRVFRLFKRVKSLRVIMNSLANAIPGVMNAFLIQLIVMCIYAIIAVDRFQDYGEGGFFLNEKGVAIDLSTGRDQDFGFEYFGDFGKSLYTMFQVLTGESWSEVIARPLFHSNNPTTSMGAAFFFVTFVIVNAVVLINVVVAVLLEKMVADPETAGDEGESCDGDEAQPADPLQENVDSTLNEVAELRNQMQILISANAVMQKQLDDVDSIKEQLSALLAHNGIKQVAPRAPVTAAPSLGLPAAAQGDDPTGFLLPQSPPREECVATTALGFLGPPSIASVREILPPMSEPQIIITPAQETSSPPAIAQFIGLNS